jgi:hypothetical protein
VWWDGREPRFLVDLHYPSVSHASCHPTVAVSVPVGLAKAANTDGLAHVDVTSDGGGADVEPVDVLGRQLLGVYVIVRRENGECRSQWRNVRDVLTVSTQPVDKRSAS